MSASTLITKLQGVSAPINHNNLTYKIGTAQEGFGNRKVEAIISLARNERSSCSFVNLYNLNQVMQFTAKTLEACIDSKNLDASCSEIERAYENITYKYFHMLDCVPKRNRIFRVITQVFLFFIGMNDSYKRLTEVVFKSGVNGYRSELHAFAKLGFPYQAQALSRFKVSLKDMYYDARDAPNNPVTTFCYYNLAELYTYTRANFPSDHEIRKGMFLGQVLLEEATSDIQLFLKGGKYQEKYAGKNDPKEQMFEILKNQDTYVTKSFFLFPMFYKNVRDELKKQNKVNQLFEEGPLGDLRNFYNDYCKTMRDHFGNAIETSNDQRYFNWTHQDLDPDAELKSDSIPT